MDRLTKQTVLSVDDEPRVLRSLQRIMRKLDAEILVAESGEEALEILGENQVDVILSDMRMPGMSGAEFLAQAKKISPNSQRILLTGYADTESAILAVNEGGISRYISKPWDDAALIETVTEALETTRLKQENIFLLEESARKTVELEKLNENLQRLNDSLERKVAERTCALEDALKKLRSTAETMVDLIANVAELPNVEHKSTGRKITLAVAIGKGLNLDIFALVDLRRAMRLHRLGWATLPPGLTDKRFTDMSEEEQRLYRNQPLLAQALLVGVPQLAEVGIAIANQHENFDGSGFPTGVEGRNIPLLARIIAVARDYFDLRRGRFQAESLSPVRALEKITAAAGSIYDPDIVDAFSLVVPTIEQLDDGGGDHLVLARSLNSGMTLSRDLLTAEGAVLLSSGHVITEAIASTITRYDEKQDTPLEIYVVDEPRQGDLAEIDPGHVNSDNHDLVNREPK